MFEDLKDHTHRGALAVRQAANRLSLAINNDATKEIARAVIEALPQRKWFVGVTKDGMELTAARGLREQKFGVEVPRAWEAVQMGKRIIPRPVMRFPGYIFISFDPRLENFSPIKNTKGMDGDGDSPLLLKGDRTPESLPPGIIEAIRGLEDDELKLLTARKKTEARHALKPGDRVVIQRDSASQPGHGRKGQYLGVENGIAFVLEGIWMWRVPMGDLTLDAPPPAEGEGE